MKTTFTTYEMKRRAMTKFRAGVTFLVSSMAGALSVVETTIATITLMALMTTSVANASVSPRDANLNIGLAQQIVNHVYQETMAKHIVSSYEVAAPRDRIEHPCVDECTCISTRFTAALKRYGYSTRTIFLKPTQKTVGIRIRGARPSYGILTEANYDTHVVTAVRLLGGWRVVDPVATNGTTFLKFQDWRRLIQTPVDMSVRAN